MDDFLTKMFQDEQEKIAAADTEAYFNLMSVNELEDYLGIVKEARPRSARRKRLDRVRANEFNRQAANAEAGRGAPPRPQKRRKSRKYRQQETARRAGRMNKQRAVPRPGTPPPPGSGGRRSGASNPPPPTQQTRPRNTQSGVPKQKAKVPPGAAAQGAYKATGVPSAVKTTVVKPSAVSRVGSFLRGAANTAAHGGGRLGTAARVAGGTLALGGAGYGASKAFGFGKGKKPAYSKVAAVGGPENPPMPKGMAAVERKLAAKAREVRALEKEKEAGVPWGIAAPALAGGALGAAYSRKGHGVADTARGAGVGAATGVGAGLGGVGGAIGGGLAGAGTGALLGSLGGAKGRALGAAVGAGAGFGGGLIYGGVKGGKKGYSVGKKHMWDSAKGRGKKEKKAEALYSADAAGRIMAKIAAKGGDDDAKFSVKPKSWVAGQRGSGRAMSHKGEGKVLTDKLVGRMGRKGVEQAKKGMGVGASVGGLAGIATGLAAARKGKKLPAAALLGLGGAGFGTVTGASIGNSRGQMGAMNDHLRKKGIKSSWGGMKLRYTPKAAKKYL